MTKFAAPALALLLSGCATATEMARSPADRVYSSNRPRDVVAECLLDRVTASGLRPERIVSANATTVAFTGTDGLVDVGLYLFTIRDQARGSLIEARVLRGLGTPDLAAAETCF